MSLMETTPHLTTIRNKARAGRADAALSIDTTVADLIANDAPVAMGVSGGKDSVAMAIRVVRHLDAVGHKGPRVLVHSDLGRVEWKDSLPSCERLAAALGLELIVVKRAAGDMMDRWLVRWSNNVERYANLECVRVILPWSTPSMRFCTSELKTAVICRELIRRFPGRTIVSASGIRREESSARAKAPTSKPQPKLSSKKHATSGVDWAPIADLTERDVWATLESAELAPHEAYSVFGMSRVSCAFCIMGSADDLVASASCPDNADVYREMVDLEIESGFAFQGGKWLADVAPDLLTADQRIGITDAKEGAAARSALEAEIPKHLLYTEGWPTVMPTDEEAAMLARVRTSVGAILGIPVKYATAAEVTARYAELMAAKEARA